MSHLLEFGLAAAVAYGLYTHISLATIKADIKSAFTKVDATITTVKQDLQKYV